MDKQTVKLVDADTQKEIEVEVEVTGNAIQVTLLGYEDIGACIEFWNGWVRVHTYGREWLLDENTEVSTFDPVELKESWDRIYKEIERGNG